MRKITLVAMLLLAFGSASAQRIEDFKAKLAEPALNDSLGMTGKVVVREVGTAATAVQKCDAAQSPETVKGFRIVIFFDNGSSARANAEATIESFNVLYPDVRSYMGYENPYFKVLVGGCVTSEEAIVLLGRITPNFPKAYITREDIKLEELAEPKQTVVFDPNAEPVTAPAEGAAATTTM